MKSRGGGASTKKISRKSIDFKKISSDRFLTAEFSQNFVLFSVFSIFDFQLQLNGVKEQPPTCEGGIEGGKVKNNTFQL